MRHLTLRRMSCRCCICRSLFLFDPQKLRIEHIPCFWRQASSLNACLCCRCSPRMNLGGGSVWWVARRCTTNLRSAWRCSKTINRRCSSPTGSMPEQNVDCYMHNDKLAVCYVLAEQAKAKIHTKNALHSDMDGLTGGCVNAFRVCKLSCGQ